MIARLIGLIAGPTAFALTLVAPAPERMSPEAWRVAGLVV
jgi:hypothetical protein